MSLKAFHIFFITVSTLFALGFGVWCLKQSDGTPSSQLLWLGVVSILGGVGLVVYGKLFLEKMKREGIR